MPQATGAHLSWQLGIQCWKKSEQVCGFSGLQARVPSFKRLLTKHAGEIVQLSKTL
jgi:hypothetical protein